MTPFLTMVLLSVISSMFAALVPSWIWRKGVRRSTLRNFLGFSAGILLCIATIDLIPEGMALIMQEQQQHQHQPSHREGKVPHVTNARDKHEDHHDHGGGGGGHHDHGGSVLSDHRLVMLGVATGYFLLVFMEQAMMWFGVAHTHADGSSHGHHGGHGHQHDHNSQHRPTRKNSKERSHHFHQSPDPKPVVGSFDRDLYLLEEQQPQIEAAGDPATSSETLSERFSLSAFVALGIHSIIDGVVIGGSFQVSAALGGRVALGIVMHKVPDGFVIASLLAATQRQSKFLWILALSSMTPTGAALGFTLLGAAQTHVLGFVLGVAAGTFLFISMSAILPDLLKDASIDRPETLFPILASISGYALILVLQEMIGHAH